MISSIFNRVYSYRERKDRSAQENFLVEILAFCLETDKVFLDHFLQLLYLPESGKYVVNTQTAYDLGRPDIAIYNDQISIIIECKVEHTERNDQLEDYAKILLLNNKEKYLVYLTKYYECKELKNKNVNFHQLKWADIYNIIDENNNQVTVQFKEYIREQNMAYSNNFQYQDLTALQTITATIHKMDEVLDGIRSFFESKVGRFSKDSSRSTRLAEERYVNWHTIVRNREVLYSVEAGFYWWDGDVSLALRIVIPTRKNENARRIKKYFDGKLPLWETDDNESAYNFWYYKSVSQFIIDDEEQIPSMVLFLREGLDEFDAYECNE